MVDTYQDDQTIERIVRMETDIKWMKKEIDELRKAVNRSRWELVGGVVIIIMVQVILRLAGWS